MNKNIEILIPNRVAAVRFSYIPFMQEIEYTPDDTVPAYTEPLRITDDGRMFLLNKDHPAYSSVKDIIMRVSKMPKRALKLYRKSLMRKPQQSTHEILCTLCVDAEFERRAKEKAVKGYGKH